MVWRSMDKYFVPDGVSLHDAQKRVTHMAIGAHQDDLEIFAFHGIAECYLSDTDWFAGVTVTDGGGSARSGPYQGFTDKQMKEERHLEQNRAARIGRYSFQAQLGAPSSLVKDRSKSKDLVNELLCLLEACRPRTLYLHNPADKHDTHVATLIRCLEALRRMEPEARPERVYGCEVWRDLDWADDSSKVALPVGVHPELARELLAVFRSQVEGGKDYVEATLGRRRANATFYHSHEVDGASGYTFALDLTPLLRDEGLGLQDFALSHLKQFESDIRARVQKFEL